MSTITAKELCRRSTARDWVVRVLESSKYDDPSEYDIEAMVGELTAANGGTYDLYMLDWNEFWDICDRHRRV